MMKSSIALSCQLVHYSPSVYEYGSELNITNQLSNTVIEKVNRVYENQPAVNDRCSAKPE